MLLCEKTLKIEAVITVWSLSMCSAQREVGAGVRVLCSAEVAGSGWLVLDKVSTQPASYLPTEVQLEKRQAGCRV